MPLIWYWSNIIKSKSFKFNWNNSRVGKGINDNSPTGVMSCLFGGLSIVKWIRSTDGSELRRFLQLLNPIFGSPETSITFSLSLMAFISMTALLFWRVNSSGPGSTSIFNVVIPALSKGKVIFTVSPTAIDLDCLLSLFIFIETRALGTLIEISSIFIFISISSPTIPNLGADSIINLLSFSSFFSRKQKVYRSFKIVWIKIIWSILNLTIWYNYCPSNSVIRNISYHRS